MIRNINNYLFISLGFFIPLSIAVTNILIVLITLLWIIEGDFKKKFIEIKENEFVVAILLFLMYHLMGSLWSDIPLVALQHTAYYYILLASAVFLTTLESQHVNKSISAFILAMMISEIGSYAMYFGWWKGLAHDPYTSAFLGHVAYAPMLAFTVFLLLNQLLFSQVSMTKKIYYAIFIVTMTFNIFISGGRAGQLVFVLLSFIFSFLYLRKNFIIFFSSLLLIPVIVVTLYFTNDAFQLRTDQSIKTLQTGSKNGGLGERLNFARNSLEIVPTAPIFGVGTGDFSSAYVKINQKNSPQQRPTGQPHNQYLYILVQLGIVGLVFLLFIFYNMYRISKNYEDDTMNKIRFLFLFHYLIIMFSDIYLFAFATQAMFAYFGIILYKKYRLNPFVVYENK